MMIRLNFQCLWWFFLNKIYYLWIYIWLRLGQFKNLLLCKPVLQYSVWNQQIIIFTNKSSYFQCQEEQQILQKVFNNCRDRSVGAAHNVLTKDTLQVCIWFPFPLAIQQPVSWEFFQLSVEITFAGSGNYIYYPHSDIAPSCKNHSSCHFTNSYKSLFSEANSSLQVWQFRIISQCYI